MLLTTDSFLLRLFHRYFKHNCCDISRSCGQEASPCHWRQHNVMTVNEANWMPQTLLTCLVEYLQYQSINQSINQLKQTCLVEYLLKVSSSHSSGSWIWLSIPVRWRGVGTNRVFPP